MKTIFYPLILTFYLNSIFANESVEHSFLELPPKMHFDTPTAPNKYSYFTVGSSVLLQQVGIGQRYKNFETFKGHDISLNAHFSLPLLSGIDRFKYPIYPSMKYTFLKYKNNSPTAPYFGIAFEGVLAVDKPRYYHSLSQSVVFIPNLGLIWGKERENIRFTQLQFNVIPAVALVAGTGMLLFGSSKGAIISDREGGMFLALGSASILCSYSAGF